jgi:CDP-diacylglycerol--glycerol-3-phosphate 3-phosphatidyltransferase
MNLPNKITIMRILLAFIFTGCLFAGGLACISAALFLFVTAILSDYFDGWLARKQNEVTDFGRIMDPVADKVLTLSAFIAFVDMDLVPAWMVIIIVFRELSVTSLRIKALKNGEVISASVAGKHKTVSQMLSILLILIFMIIREAGGISTLDFWGPQLENIYRNIIYFTMLITVILTVISGFSYFRENRRLLSGEETRQ